MQTIIHSINIQTVDYAKQRHAEDLMLLLNYYANSPMGGGQPLSDHVQRVLIEELQKVGGAISLLAYEGKQAVGLLNAFTGFSTFAAKPLINIHDVMVLESHRGQGVAQELLTALELIALERECCKLTLEVLSENKPAQKSYQRFGFSRYELDPKKGCAQFWEKKLG